ncbi:MAG TPA: 30S ribosomal protein S17 [Atribacter sp.]|jgi:small subunit ribosomal protein S17|uniref:Small ribosomal subunit protein uS17 n=1 Tax=Candidatus Atribacter allofermentans TaxID=1852833 RepID=A0A1V5T4J7_9BACT|nr:30S ribosomal protein S17 [Atribacter sp.]MDD3713842.1 30S ribosomal protein S17 [Atribacterota bacterium]OQA61544.1 MAG: 30S ribosomal protein S17 [Candidatus Atribacteria bacterium ADurb.Bin276]HHT11070.1 30S ribosomal protein S17 [Candidatus Atribacteria bacterium]MDI9593965.1 30S ribosomal protein S17 [Atribacterota bacterium]HQK83573.1 30S ribosomal protein S17 [Atribacter sp.]
MADRKRFTGEIISNKMDKTVLVRVIRISEHPFYKKKMKKSKKYKAHDEAGICDVGDRVIIEETRPLSKTVRWRVVDVTLKAKIKGGEDIDSIENNA